MNTKQFFSTTVFALFLIFAFWVSADAQAKDSNLTWNELKEIQTRERTMMENRQKDELLNLKEMHKAELEAVKGNTGPTASLSERYSAERITLSKIHAEERAKLAQTHAEERKTFLQNKR